MIYGYARCSTDEQKQDITRQERDLTAMGAEEIFAEYASGTDADRAQLAALWARMGEGDTIAATELSRITRSVHQLCHLLEDARARRIIIRAGGLLIDATGPIDPVVECMAFVFAAFAQLEIRQTVARIHSGIAHARASGKHIGRPRVTPNRLPRAFKRHLPAYESGQISIVEFARRCGRSRQTIYRWLAITRGGGDKP